MMIYRLTLLKNLLFAALLLPAYTMPGAVPGSPTDWKAKVTEALPLLGHRNWILVVDSAYPAQISPGVEMIETNADQIQVTQAVLAAINSSIHVRPIIYMDSELPFVPEKDAPGASAYRAGIGKVLQSYKVESLLHEMLIAKVDEAGKTFRVLILKTNMTVPYSSVFIRLDCKYWSADAEARVREKMKGSQP